MPLIKPPEELLLVPIGAILVVRLRLNLLPPNRERAWAGEVCQEKSIRVMAHITRIMGSSLEAMARILSPNMVRWRYL